MTQMDLDGISPKREGIISDDQKISQSLDRGVPFESDELPPNKYITGKWHWAWAFGITAEEISKRVQELKDAEQSG